MGSVDGFSFAQTNKYGRTISGTSMSKLGIRTTYYISLLYTINLITHNISYKPSLEPFNLLL